ncbi:UDP-3-O-(3-hydroxymyristoyl)glucosamine N-acyltransferase [Ignavibacteria bacterium]|nr:UDP-3-O-(3-hydroxymyristoyl)glucosamine N-acyltransferase [Bacteroidota bacterium]MCZ2133160.1 UDP-3-O-(3-hydroxymyristoyl)glucosamine N-acyltransferase [Bacteroidota bacterium]
MAKNSDTHSGWTISDLAVRFGGEVVGILEDVPPILRPAPLDEAGIGDIAFYADKRYTAVLAATRATCTLIPRDCTFEPAACAAFIKVDDPHRAFVRFLGMVDELRPKPAAGIHQTAVIDHTAVVASTAAIMAGCVVGARCVIGENVVLYPNVTLYDNVSVGANTIVHAGVICGTQTEIGERCTIQPGAVIGSDGFGFVENSDGSYDKIPHIGRVVIDNDVEIGANTTIDRSVAGITRIGRGVKIDNLVQIAHNVRIGEDTAVVAQTGIAGSTVIGRRVRLAGQVGIVGHISIADGVVVLAQSGVSKSLSEAGMYLGSPAQPHGNALRLTAVLRNLPDALAEIRNELHELHERTEPKSV